MFVVEVAIPQKIPQIFKTPCLRGIGEHMETQLEGLRETTTLGTLKDYFSRWNQNSRIKDSQYLDG